MPGVLRVLTGDDWVAAGFGELPCIWAVDSRDGTPMREATRPAIVAFDGGQGEVRHVGDIVAVVVAESAALAADAALEVEVDYEPRPAIVDTARALDAGAPLVHERSDQPLFRHRLRRSRGGRIGDRRRGDGGRAHARQRPHRAEPARAARHARPPRPAGRPLHALDLRQNPHLVRRWLAENSLHIPEHRIRVVSPDVGGGFGQKISHYPEEPLVLWVARLLGRPARWSGSRSENFLEDTQARDHVTRCRMAFDAGGRILALEVDTVAAIGAYATAFEPRHPGPFLRAVARGHVSHTRDLRSRARRLHQHGAGRRLSRRGPPRGDVCRRAAGGRRRATHGHRPD